MKKIALYALVAVSTASVASAGIPRHPGQPQRSWAAWGRASERTVIETRHINPGSKVDIDASVNGHQLTPISWGRNQMELAGRGILVHVSAPDHGKTVIVIATVRPNHPLVRVGFWPK